MKPYLWLYWEEENVPEPGFIRLCRETIMNYCGSDFEVILTTPENVREYLPDTKIEFEKIGAVQYSYAAVRAAYIRVALLQRYGGIWIDSDTIMTTNFKSIWEKTEEKGFSTVSHPPWGKYYSNCMLASVPEGDFITLYMDTMDEFVAEQPELKVPWLGLGAYMLSPLVMEYGKDRIHSEPYYLIQPILSGAWGMYFEDIEIEDAVDRLKKGRYFPDLSFEDIHCFTLCNQSFPVDFMMESEMEILIKDTLISRLFWRSLDADF